MAELVSLQIKAHDNIYIKEKEARQRNLRIEMGLPEAGTNKDTGVLIFIPGYGGDIDSNVYKKMRNTFPELYNVVTLQCDYFGNCYMSAPDKVEVPKEEYGKVESVDWFHLGEGIEEFNDMGVMQALDIVTATLYCLQYCRENGYCVDKSRIIIFGTSHGGYLGHLANLICPGLYAWLIDICSYMKPYYFERTRDYTLKPNPAKIKDVKITAYLTAHPELRYDDRLYDLSFLYRNAPVNQCKIIAFQGTKDWMVDYREKIRFIEEIGSSAQLMLIEEKDVDGILCKSADHGLDMDLLVLFEMLMPMLMKPAEGHVHKRGFIQEQVKLGAEDAVMCIDYKTGRPILTSIKF